jgi:hypothetical protein
LPMKKFIIVTAEAKAVLRFLLCHMIHESAEYYKNNDMKFPETGDETIAAIVEFAETNLSDPIFPFVASVVAAHKGMDHINIIHAGLADKLYVKVKDIFKNIEDQESDVQVRFIIKQYVTLINILAVYTTCAVIEKRAACNYQLLQGFINILAANSCATFPEIKRIELVEYVEISKPEKKPKKAGEGKKPAPKKAPSKNSKRGRPPAKGKKSKKDEEKDSDSGSDQEEEYSGILENLSDDEYDEVSD